MGATMSTVTNPTELRILLHGLPDSRLLPAAKAAALYGDRTIFYGLPVAILVDASRIIRKNPPSFSETDADDRLVLDGIELSHAVDDGLLEIDSDLAWPKEVYQEVKDQREELAQVLEARGSSEPDLAAMLKARDVSWGLLATMFQPEFRMIQALQATPGAWVMKPMEDSGVRFIEALFPHSSSSTADRSTTALGIASTLFSGLPGFSNASFADIRDIKRELREPLMRFRAQTLRLAEAVSASPNDPDWLREMDLVARRDVSPVVEDLKHEIAASRQLREMAFGLFSKSALPSSGLGTLGGVAVAQGMGWGAATAAAVGASVGVAAAVIQEAASAYFRTETSRQNGLFFVVELDNRMKVKA
jgi:hypothetical protein